LTESGGDSTHASLLTQPITPKSRSRKCFLNFLVDSTFLLPSGSSFLQYETMVAALARDVLYPKQIYTRSAKFLTFGTVYLKHGAMQGISSNRHGSLFTTSERMWQVLLSNVFSPSGHGSLLWYVVVQLLQEPHPKNRLRIYSQRNLAYSAWIHL
jgi:hypothetical protein